MCGDSYVAARLAVGALVDVTDRVAHGAASAGVALIRPPGHHAERDKAMGFCLFNNVGVAAAVARRRMGVERVLIVDWDVHHGNGTQHMFDGDPSVLYFSVHRFDHGHFYPGSGAARECGDGAGEGFSVNVPWPGGGFGDEEYAAVFSEVLLPIAREFDPHLVLVCAGFDAAAGDPLGGCDVSPEGARGVHMRGVRGGVHDAAALRTSRVSCAALAPRARS